MNALRDFIRAHPRLAVLTGAGVSTSSGIPDYRDVHGDWKRARPVEFRPFMTDPECASATGRAVLSAGLSSVARSPTAHIARSRGSRRWGPFGS